MAATSEGENDSTEKLDFDTVIGIHDSPSGDTLSTAVEKARRYANRLGANLKSSPLGHAFINGKHANIAEVSTQCVRPNGAFCLLPNFRTSSQYFK